MFRAAKVLLILAAISLSGCGAAKEKKPVETLAPASGTVTVDGKPVAGVIVSFIPVGTFDSRGGSAITDDEGEFRLQNYMKMDGVPPGNYMAIFSLKELADGAKVSKTSLPIPGITAKEKIPPLWSDLQKGGKHNSVTIPSSGTEDLKFEIPLK